MSRKEDIDFLVANCDCWKSPGDREILNSLSDEKLEELVGGTKKQQHAIVVANAAVRGFKSDGNEYRINPENGNWERRKMVANAPADDYEEEEDDDEPLDEPPSRKPSNNSASQNRPQTMEDWFRNAPVEVQNTFNTARQVEQREKDKIIQELLVNVADSEREAHREWLQTRPLGELANMLSLVPKPQPKQDQTPKFRPIRNQYDDDTLQMPTMNFGEGGEEAEESGQHAPTGNDGGYVSEDEWLRAAPPSIQRKVHNAAVWEEQERRKLIAELTANIRDEDAERQLSWLNSLPLERLRSMTVFAPKKDAQPKNYFGSAGGPISNNRPGQQSSGGGEDDMLLPPTVNYEEEARSVRKKTG